MQFCLAGGGGDGLLYYMYPWTKPQDISPFGDFYTSFHVYERKQNASRNSKNMEKILKFSAFSTIPIGFH